jgi:hypothetical protein
MNKTLPDSDPAAQSAAALPPPLRELAAIVVSPESHPEFTAVLIGRAASSMFRIFREKGDLKKGRVKQFEKRAFQLEEEGVRVSWTLRGGEFCLQGAETLKKMGMSVDDKLIEALSFLHRELYRSQRAELAKAVLFFLVSLCQHVKRRPRGRPKKSFSHSKRRRRSYRSYASIDGRLILGPVTPVTLRRNTASYH